MGRRSIRFRWTDAPGAHEASESETVAEAGGLLYYYCHCKGHAEVRATWVVSEVFVISEVTKENYNLTHFPIVFKESYKIPC